MDSIRIRPLKDYLGYKVYKRVENGEVLYFTYGLSDEMISNKYLADLKKMINADRKVIKNNEKKRYSEPWMRQIRSLMRDFCNDRYFKKVVDETLKENPGMDDDGLFHMAHKKVVALI